MLNKLHIFTLNLPPTLKLFEAILNCGRQEIVSLKTLNSFNRITRGFERRRGIHKIYFSIKLCAFGLRTFSQNFGPVEKPLSQLQ